MRKSNYIRVKSEKVVTMFTFFKKILEKRSLKLSSKLVNKKV